MTSWPPPHYAVPEGGTGLLMVGTFLSGSGRGSYCVCEALADRFSAAGLRVVTTSSRRSRISRIADMLDTTWRRRSQYSVASVEVYSGLGFLWAEAVTKLLRHLGKPYVLTLHGGNLPQFARRWPSRVRRLLHSAKMVTVPSRYLQETLCSYRRDLRLVPNPLDLGSYAFHQRTGSGNRLVWLRAFHATYNPSLAARVVARLHADFPELQLTMIGPDKGDGSLQDTIQTARELGVEGLVDIVGGVPKSAVPAHLSKGDIFLNTTNVDNAPVSVMEAMASGMCVVSTAVGGLPYLLDDGRNALLVPPDDPDAMADAIRRILTEPELASRLSANARREAERADWSHVLPQWLEIFQQLAPIELSARLTA